MYSFKADNGLILLLKNKNKLTAENRGRLVMSSLWSLSKSGCKLCWHDIRKIQMVIYKT